MSDNEYARELARRRWQGTPPVPMTCRQCGEVVMVRQYRQWHGLCKHCYKRAWDRAKQAQGPPKAPPYSP